MGRLLRFTLLVALSCLLAAQGRFVPGPVGAVDSQPLAAGAFRFISWGDGQGTAANFAATARQAASLSPAFTIFNGDLEQDGVRSTEMAAMKTAMGSLYTSTFLVRGNHDDHVSGSAGLWENYWTAANRPLPAGVSNYTALNSASDYLTYSFDYGNSRFIGVDVPGDPDLLSSAELSFMDARLTDAETRGLTHAFIFFHGGEYCIANHCGCSAKSDGSCTPSALVNLLNKHPIVSATFHGHEHFLAWIHMSSARVASLKHPYEEFFTSPSGGYSTLSELYPARVDYYYPGLGDSQGFASVNVSGSSFTVNLYKVGSASPVFSKTFSRQSSTSTAVFRSLAAADGQLVESSEISNVGGSASAVGISFNLGDDAARRQLRAVLSFNTASLPDNAVIKSAVLTLTRRAVVPPAGNPFSVFQGLLIDVRRGFFGSSAALQASDFQAPASLSAQGPFNPAPVGAVYRIALPPAAYPYINKVSSNGGVTQLRLRFKLDDNNDAIANYIAFLSGDYAAASSRPALTISYSQP